MPLDNSYTSGSVGATYAGHLGHVEGITYKLLAGVSYVFSAGGEIGEALNLAPTYFMADVIPFWPAPVLYMTPAAPWDATVFVLNVGNKAGDYTLKAASAADDFSANAATTGTLALGAGRDGVLESMADRDWFASVLVAGQTYDFSLAKGGRALAVYDAAGHWIEASNQADTLPVLQFTPLVSGRYFIQVGDTRIASNDSTASSYTLNATLGMPDDVPKPQTISPGTTLTGQIETPNDTDSFLLDLAKDHFYQFLLEKQLAPDGPYERIRNTFGLEHMDGNAVLDTGRPLADPQNDGYFAPAASGSYRLSLNSANTPEIPAGYRLTVLDTGLADDFPATAPGSATLAVGGVASGAIQVVGDTDSFSVTLAAGQRIALGLYGAGSGLGSLPLSPSVGFYTETINGMPVGSSWALNGPVSHAELTASAAGVYSIYVNSYAVTGSYTVRVLDISGDTAAPVISAAQPASFAWQAPLVLHFNELLFGAPFSDGTITLSDAQGRAIARYNTSDAAHVAFAEDTATLIPDAPLEAGKSYRISFQGHGISDWAHNSQTQPGDFTFTVAAPASAPGAGNDVYAGRNDGRHIDGGAGLDAVAYTGSAAGHTIASDGKGGFTVAAPGLQADTLSGIERMYFSGQADAIALDVAGVGGEAYRLYQAAFDRVPDKIGLGFWMAALERGTTLHDVAQAFIGSAEFTGRYGANPGDAGFVTQLYQNVLHRAGESGGFNFWVGKLHDGLARADVLAAFSESAENQATLAAIIGNGFAYTPHL